MEKPGNNEIYEGNSINSIDLDSMIRNYILSESVPEAETNSIFDKIENNGKKSNSYFKSTSGLIFSFIPSCFDSLLKTLSFLTVSSLLFFANYPVNKTTGKETAKSNIKISSNYKKYEIPAISSCDIIENNSTKKYNAGEEEGIINSNLSDQTDIPVNLNILNKSVIKKSIIINPIFQNTNESNTNIVLLNSENSGRSRFFYESRISKFSGLTNDNKPAPEQAIMKDCSFGLWYNISSVFSAGAELRQESFTLKKSDAVMNSDSIYAMNMTCWELGVKYSPEVFIYEARPFLQFNIGGGKLGMITRFSAGLAIPVADNFKIITGAEINSLLYSTKSIISTTNRIGFNGSD